MKIVATLCLLVFSLSAYSQSCCESPNEKFAALGEEEAFRMKHEEPRELGEFKQKGHMITFPCPDGKEANAYLINASSYSNKWLFVIHEWWGLNDHIKQESDQFSESFSDVNVIAVDMYDGKVAENREDASAYMKGMTQERAFAIISGLYSYAGGKASVCTIGWCFGGGWSLQTAIEGGDRAIGCVIYYGMPENSLERLSLLECDVLGIFALQEQWISPKVVAEFQENMAAVNKKLEVHSFDADHAFANPSSPRYVEKAAQEANELSMEYLSEKFK